MIAGASGGNAAGAVQKNLCTGLLLNSMLGVVGCGLGMRDAGGGIDKASFIGSLASGGIGGGALMAIVGFVKNMMAKS